MRALLGNFFAIAVASVASEVVFAQQNVVWGFTVSPTSVSIRQGQSVTWNGNMSIHPLAESNATFTQVGATLANSGSSFTRSFPDAGTYYFICAVHSSMQSTVVVRPVCEPPSGIAHLDIDGNGEVSSTTDGLLLLRYMLGLRGPSLVNGAVAIMPAPTRTPQQIEAFLGACATP